MVLWSGSRTGLKMNQKAVQSQKKNTYEEHFKRSKEIQKLVKECQKTFYYLYLPLRQLSGWKI